MREDRLIQQLKQGNSEAVRVWFAEFRPQVAAFVQGKVSPHADAEEIVQEVFLHCLHQLPLFRGESKLSTWMLSIARHEVADYYRKKYAKKALKTFPLGELVLSSPVQDSHELSARVQEVLVQMSDRSRELLLRKYVDGRKVAELAREFGKSAKAIESELFRARGEFRELWRASEDAYAP